MIIILCYVWFGLNEVAAILAVSLNKIPMVAVIMREGSRAIEKDYLQVDEILNYQINDDIYYILTKKYVELFLELDNTNNLKYSSNKNDCDDFAHILYGNVLLSEYNTEKLKNASLTFGVVYGIYNNDYHSYNIFYANNNFYCIEPQEDAIGLCNEFIYKPRLILL